MAIRKWTDDHGNERFTVDYYPNGRKGRRAVFALPVGSTEVQADEIHRELKARKKNIHTAPPSGNIARLIKRYINHCTIHQSPETARDKESAFNTHIIPFFGHMHVTDLTNAHITAFKQQAKQRSYRDNKITNRTITKVLNYFSAFLKWIDEETEGDIRPPVQLRFRKLPHTRPVPTVLSLYEAMAFINAADQRCRHADRCPGNRGNPNCTFKVAYNVLFKIFFYLGLRNRAARTLAWEDVDWSKRAIKTLEKGRKVKWHPLPDDLHAELRTLYIGSSSKWIFPSPIKPQQPVTDLKKGVARAKKKAGITKRVYPHLLRHSIGTHLLDSDVDIRQIQSFLGHSHVSTTEFYTQVSIEKKRQALEKAGIKTSKM